MAMKKDTVETGKRQFCTFWLSSRHFGVDILDVKEINSGVSFTPIFHAPDEVKGYINIRGEIYLILDLRLILGFQSKEEDALSRVILFDSRAGEPFGILVDSIGDIVTVDEEEIENRRTEDRGPGEEGIERRQFDLGDGVCKLADDLLVVLNCRGLLNIISDLCNAASVPLEE